MSDATTRRKPHTSVARFVCAAALALTLTSPSASPATTTDRLGNAPGEAARLLAAPAPEIELPDLDGRVQTLSSLRGDLVLVNFWATWCPPCRKEMPLFQDRFERFGAQGFHVFAVAVDDVAAVRAFADEFGLAFPIVVGQREAFAAGQAFGNAIGALPYSVLVGRDGHILDIHRGEVDAELLDAWLERHLGPSSAPR